MPMYNLIEYSESYSETYGSSWQYDREEPFLDDNGAIADFPANTTNSASFRFKIKIAGRIGNNGTKNVKIRVPLKYLSKFWRTLEMSLINSEINLILTWSARCFIIDTPVAAQGPTFTITNTKLYVPVVTLSTQDNSKLREQKEQQNRYLDFLLNPRFQGVIDLLFYHLKIRVARDIIFH